MSECRRGSSSDSGKAEHNSPAVGDKEAKFFSCQVPRPTDYHQPLSKFARVLRLDECIGLEEPLKREMKGVFGSAALRFWFNPRSLVSSNVLAREHFVIEFAKQLKCIINAGYCEELTTTNVPSRPR